MFNSNYPYNPPQYQQNMRMQPSMQNSPSMADVFGQVGSPNMGGQQSWAQLSAPPQFQSQPQYDYSQYQNTDFNPRMSPGFGQNDTQPYIRGVPNSSMRPMSGGMNEQALFPLQSSTATPFLNQGADSGTPSFKQGGHIPRFKRGGFFGNPKKWLKSVVGGGAGAILGNMLLPGFGGVAGGAIGNALGAKIRGRKDVGMAALKGAGMGLALPTMASTLGAGASALGVNGAGNALTNYGANNSIMSALGMGAANNLPTVSVPDYMPQEAAHVPNMKPSFLDSLAGNTKDYFSQPSNLLTMGIVGSQFMNRPKAPKEKSPEQLANEERRLRNARRMSPEEVATERAYIKSLELSPEEEAMEMRRHREAFRMSPEELAQEEAYLAAVRDVENRHQYGIKPNESVRTNPLHRKVNSPEEYQRTGKWVEYYDNPEHQGMAKVFKDGGYVDGNFSNFPAREVEMPMSMSGLLRGMGGGQQDNVRRQLPENSYIIDASTVSDIGDGNTERGGKMLDALVSNGEYEVFPEAVTKLGEGDVDKGVEKLDSLVKNVRKAKRGGKAKLPPKLGKLSKYMKK